jgi:hypothetical protein
MGAIMRFMNTAQALITEIEKRAAAKGIPVRRVVRAAGINVSTWSRWKSGETTPTFRLWDRIRAKADELFGDAA